MAVMSDPIADMLTRIRNANTAKHDSVDIPSSRVKAAIAEILLKEGYIKSYEIDGDDVRKTIHVSLKYGRDKNEKVIHGSRWQRVRSTTAWARTRRLWQRWQPSPGNTPTT